MEEQGRGWKKKKKKEKKFDRFEVQPASTSEDPRGAAKKPNWTKPRPGKASFA